MSSAHQAVARARGLVTIGRYHDALAILVPYLDSDGVAFEARCLASQCNVELGNLEIALEQAEWALPLRPWDDWPHRLMAIVHLRRGRGGRQAALRHASEAARLAPAAPSTLHLLVVAQLANNQVDAAAATAEIALETNPHETLAHHSHALVCEQLKDWAAAEDAYRAALALDPDDADLSLRLGHALEKRGRRHHAAAGEAFVAAARANPADDAPRKRLAALGLPAAIIGLVKVGPYLAARGLADTGASALPLVAMFCGLLLAVAAIVAFFRIHATRHLPADVRRGLRADYWDEAMGWVAYAGIFAVFMGVVFLGVGDQDPPAAVASMGFGVAALYLARHRILRALRAPARWYRHTRSATR